MGSGADAHLAPKDTMLDIMGRMSASMLRRYFIWRGLVARLETLSNPASMGSLRLSLK
jgi:hypothetical protein